MKPRRRIACCAMALALLMSAGCRATVLPIEGIVWQPDNETVTPQGQWQRLGVHRLLIQWIVVDGLAFVPNTGLPSAPRQPDWKRIASEPWAKEVIVGLAGRFDENAARSEIVELARLSQKLTRLETPLNVAGWYFPVEIDPTWSEASRLALLLDRLPRPLWVSAYDSANLGPEALASGLAKWLPADVGVFFQDGVGSHVREPAVARQYADVLVQRLGKERVRVIAEAFRPQHTGGFRPATADELRPQLAAYAGYRVYLFDGPHYVSDRLVDELTGAEAGK